MAMTHSMDRVTLEAAARGYIELHCEEQVEATREAHRQWLELDPSHRQAWARLARLQEKFDTLIPGMARPILTNARAKRRDVLKVLSILLAASAAGGVAWQTSALPNLMAGQRTGKAKLDQNWDLIAAYTYTNAQITKSTKGDEGHRPANVPRHMLSSWLSYTLHDSVLNGLMLGGGARYTGVLYGDNANTYRIDNYTLFDAGASYLINKNVTVSLNAQSLLDEKYVATCDDTYECYPGLRRTLLTSVKYSW